MASTLLAVLFSACLENRPTPPPSGTKDIVAKITPESDWYCTPIAPITTTSAVGANGKFWTNGQVLRIGFVGGDEAKKTLIKNAYASWAQSANLKFEYPTSGPYDIRVSFSPGSAWSYIGTDCKTVGAQYPTLNFGFGYGANEIAAGRSSTAEHEVGHSLGLLHEQQLAGGICWNEANVIQDLSGPPNNWSIATIRFNVLDYHNPANIITNGYDKTSIMHYAIPARWTCNNQAVNGGNKISEADRAFIAGRYPILVQPPPATGKKLTAAQVARMNAILDEAKTMLK